jgi:hypothetical protein
MRYVDFSILKGKILSTVEIIDDDEIIFTTREGEKYRMYHFQDCCETVSIEDICGDLKDLIDSEILLAEEVSNSDENPDGVPIPKYQDSFTWTFYKLATAKGFVTIRWYGESNGYYSESADFVQL